MHDAEDGELAEAPELAVVAIAEHTLVILDRALRLEHATLGDDFAPGDPPSLLAAREVAELACVLTERLHRYRATVRAALRPPDDDLPF